MGNSPNSLKGPQQRPPKNLNKAADSIKINKKPLFLKNCNFIKNEKQLRDLFHEITLIVLVPVLRHYESVPIVMVTTALRIRDAFQ